MEALEISPENGDHRTKRNKISSSLPLLFFFESTNQNFKIYRSITLRKTAHKSNNENINPYQMKFNFTELSDKDLFFLSTFRVLGYMLFKLLGVQNWTATLEDRQFLTKLNIPSSNHASRYLLKQAENPCPHKNLHMNSYRSFIHNCQKLEVTKISLNRGMDKQNCGTFHIMNYYSAIKRKKLSSQDKTQRKLKSIMLSERDQSERLQYYMIQTI